MQRYKYINMVQVKKNKGIMNKNTEVKKSLIMLEK